LPESYRFSSKIGFKSFPYDRNRDDISKGSDFEILEMETDEDYIHFLIKSEHKVSVLAIVRRLKQESTIRLW